MTQPQQFKRNALVLVLGMAVASGAFAAAGDFANNVGAGANANTTLGEVVSGETATSTGDLGAASATAANGAITGGAAQAKYTVDAARLLTISNGHTLTVSGSSDVNSGILSVTSSANPGLVNAGTLDINGYGKLNNAGHVSNLAGQTINIALHGEFNNLANASLTSDNMIINLGTMSFVASAEFSGTGIISNQGKINADANMIGLPVLVGKTAMSGTGGEFNITASAPATVAALFFNFSLANNDIKIDGGANLITLAGVDARGTRLTIAGPVDVAASALWQSTAGLVDVNTSQLKVAAGKTLTITSATAKLAGPVTLGDAIAKIDFGASPTALLNVVVTYAICPTGASFTPLAGNAFVVGSTYTVNCPGKTYTTPAFTGLGPAINPSSLKTLGSPAVAAIPATGPLALAFTGLLLAFLGRKRMAKAFNKM